MFDNKQDAIASLSDDREKDRKKGDKPKRVVLGFITTLDRDGDDAKMSQKLECALSNPPQRNMSQIGPLVDDGAPFSVIGEVELRLQ